jgi:mRNA interferase RelE/StbE
VTYRVVVLPAARRRLMRLDPAARRRVGALIDSLTNDPRPAGMKALRGMPGLLRVRSGDYRVVYRVEDRELLVLVIAVGHRREVYRSL